MISVENGSFLFVYPAKYTWPSDTISPAPQVDQRLHHTQVPMPMVHYAESKPGRSLLEVI